jgi:DNA-binding LacI/PurR family transcriptional regulator
MAPPKPQTSVPLPEPSTQSVAVTLREKIESGRYQAGAFLPAERKLALEMGVDRRVIRTAVNELVRSGHAIRRPHCRPVVRSLGASRSDVGGSAGIRKPPVSNFVALLMCHGSARFEGEFTSQQRIFWGMNQVLADEGRHAVFLDISEVASEAENAAREAEQLRYVLNEGFGGLIFYPYAYRRNRDLLAEVAAAMPVVTIDRQVDRLDTDFVGAANYQATYDAITHLVALGHRRIAYVSKNEPIRSVQDRLHGYASAMHDAGLAELVLPIPARSRETEWTVVDAVFQLPPSKRPTAAAAFNDFAALYLAIHLDAKGLKVPKDVSVVGFDNIVSTLANGVGLTTIAQPYEEIGRKAAELLLRRSHDRALPISHIELPTKLVVRQSTTATQLSE